MQAINWSQPGKTPGIMASAQLKGVDSLKNAAIKYIAPKNNLKSNSEAEAKDPWFDTANNLLIICATKKIFN